MTYVTSQRAVTVAVTVASASVVLATVATLAPPHDSSVNELGVDGQPTALSTSDSMEQVRLAFHAQVATLKSKLEHDSTDSHLLLQLADKLRDGHKPAEAVQYYQQYLATNPDDELAWTALVHSFADLQRWDEAEVATRTLLEINPSNMAARFNLGAIRANQGDFEEASRVWQRILDEQRDTGVAAQAIDALDRLDHLKN